MIKIFKKLDEEEINQFLKRTKGKIVSYTPNIIVEYNPQDVIDLSRYRNSFYNANGHRLSVRIAGDKEEYLYNEAVEIYISNNSIVGIDSYGEVMEIILGKEDMSIMRKGKKVILSKFEILNTNIIVDYTKFTDKYKSKLRKELVDLEGELRQLEFKTLETDAYGDKCKTDLNVPYVEALDNMFVKGDTIRETYDKINNVLYDAKYSLRNNDEGYIDVYWNKKSVILYDSGSYYVKKGFDEGVLYKLKRITYNNKEYTDAIDYTSPIDIISPSLNLVIANEDSKPLSKFSEMIYQYELQKHIARL